MYSKKSIYVHNELYQASYDIIMDLLKLFTKRQILDWSKQEEFAGDNFRFKENRKLSKWVENTVGKGEIAHYEQFLLFPHCFQKTCTADT